LQVAEDFLNRPLACNLSVRGLFLLRLHVPSIRDLSECGDSGRDLLFLGSKLSESSGQSALFGLAKRSRLFLQVTENLVNRLLPLELVTLCLRLLERVAEFLLRRIHFRTPASLEKGCSKRSDLIFESLRGGGVAIHHRCHLIELGKRALHHRVGFGRHDGLHGISQRLDGVSSFLGAVAHVDELLSVAIDGLRDFVPLALGWVVLVFAFSEL
jgi:hypothetical protein